MKKATIQTYNADCLEILRGLPDASADVFYLDPPYLYLKNQELEREFDEVELFSQVARILKPNGWVICFGRGDSFYRWNLEMANNGLKFKEEVVWNKRQNSSPLTDLARIHELLTLRCKGYTPIQLNRVPYAEIKANDLLSFANDIKRIKAIFSNEKSLQNAISFLNANQDNYSEPIRVDEHKVSTKAKNSKVGKNDFADGDRVVATLQCVLFGLKEKSVIQTPPPDLTEAESDIIEQNREHYNTIHSTQKPPRLIERLLALIIPKGQTDITVIDPFAGSMGCGVVCKDLNYNYIGCEIHPKYYELAKQRLDAHQPNPPAQTLF